MITSFGECFMWRSLFSLLLAITALGLVFFFSVFLSDIYNFKSGDHKPVELAEVVRIHKSCSVLALLAVKKCDRCDGLNVMDRGFDQPPSNFLERASPFKALSLDSTPDGYVK